jgi:radical SAM superfamily enzyme YgiQ (UPF0313 family)
MKIVFATLHVRRSEQAVALAAGCLAAALPERHRANIRLIDLYPDQSPEEMAGLLLAGNPELVAFPTYVWNRVAVLSLSQQLHQMQPGLFLVGGGPEVTGDHARLATQAPWLTLLRGEGEIGFAELVEALAGQQPVANLPGVTVMQKGQLVAGQERPPVQDCSTLPSPWLTGILTPAAGGGVLWEISRGCAFSCDYCFDSRGQEGVRELAWDRLKAELDLFVAAGVSQIWVLDSTFNFPPERGRVLLELLWHKAPHIHYHIEAKAEFLDRQSIHLLGKLSCSVQFGMQSINPAALKAVHRPLDLEHLGRQIHLLAAENVIYGFDLIYGLPEDNYRLFCSSLDAVLGFSPNHVHLFPLAVLPGTRLARQKERHGLQAQDVPPYEIISSSSWTPEDLHKSRLLAAAVDLFYNCGRAVAFFPTILKTLDDTPSHFLEDFCQWAIDRGHIDLERPVTDTATAHDAFQLQQDFLSWRLKSSGMHHLTPALMDLLSYHYHYAETLLGEPVVPTEDQIPIRDELWQTCWQTVPQVRLVRFTYEIIDLMEMEDFDLEEFAKLFRPVGSVALFLRRGNEVFCESLTEDFLHLLRHCDGTATPQQIFMGGMPRPAAEELVSFAVAEGLLQRSRA